MDTNVQSVVGNTNLRLSRGAARNWCFTYFFEGSFVRESFLSTIEGLVNEDILQYVVCQHELCPTSQRAHLQGYFQFTEKHEMSWIKTNIEGTMHLTKARGTWQENKTYCSKIETRVEGPWEWGSPKSQGSREDLNYVKKCIDRGASWRDLYVNEETFHTVAQNHKSFERYRMYTMPHGARDIEVIVHLGPAGTGKTRAAHLNFKPFTVPFYTKDHIWLDGYDGQDTLLFEEFTGQIYIETFLRITDAYYWYGECKGGFTALPNVKRIVFTTNIDPTWWYGCIPEEQENAMRRRITKIIFFNKNFMNGIIFR